MEAAPFHGLSITWHYSVQTIICLQLCQMVCVITVHVTIQILLCVKIGKPVTNMQTEKLQSLHLWKFHENCINASVSLALPLSKALAMCKHWQSLESREVRI